MKPMVVMKKMICISSLKCALTLVVRYTQHLKTEVCLNKTSGEVDSFQTKVPNLINILDEKQCI